MVNEDYLLIRRVGETIKERYLKELIRNVGVGMSCHQETIELVHKEKWYALWRNNI